MPDSVQHHELDVAPDDSTIASLRADAEADDVSVEVSFPAANGEKKRLVVSPRGTVVLLNDVSEETFNPSTSAADIADALRAG
jgi:hypothetical protein